jgi:hypothetical protein
MAGNGTGGQGNTYRRDGFGGLINLLFMNHFQSMASTTVVIHVGSTPLRL